MTDQEVIDRFHRLYYGPAHQSMYLDWPLWKSPTDMFVYQEVLHTVRPQLVVECGTAFGASALFMAHFMANAGIDGDIISIDIEAGDSFQGVKLPRHEGITYLRGMSSAASEVGEYVRARAEGKSPVMVILDSDHAEDHVRVELDAYADLVTPGSFLVVEDTNINGHPVYPEYGSGPFEAVAEWLPRHPEFEQVHPYQKYLFSFHHWLRRKA